jgi:hypothetical protein
MERWQRIWQDGLAPRLSRRGLEALRTALVRDDPRLVQGRTMTPPPLLGLHDAEVEAACALGFCGWYGDGCVTVGALEAFFDDVCTAADEALGEPAACRHFLDWFDNTPRYTMRRLLLAEVNRTLNEALEPLAA